MPAFTNRQPFPEFNSNAVGVENLELDSPSNTIDAQDTVASTRDMPSQRNIYRTANAVTNGQQSQHKPSGLESLPHEVLVNVLRHAMIAEVQPVHLQGRVGSRYRLPVPARSRNGRLLARHHIEARKTLDLFLANRAFYFAGIEAYYSGNTLAFESTAAFKRFLLHIGSDRRQEIRGIALPSHWAFGTRKPWWPFTGISQEGSPGYYILPVDHKHKVDDSDHKQDASEALSLLQEHTPRCKRLTLVIKTETLKRGGQQVVPPEVQEYIQAWLRPLWEHQDLVVSFSFSEVDEVTEEEARQALLRARWHNRGCFMHKMLIFKFLSCCIAAALIWVANHYLK